MSDKRLLNDPAILKITRGGSSDEKEKKPEFTSEVEELRSILAKQNAKLEKLEEGRLAQDLEIAVLRARNESLTQGQQGQQEQQEQQVDQKELSALQDQHHKDETIISLLSDQLQETLGKCQNLEIQLQGERKELSASQAQHRQDETITSLLNDQVQEALRECQNLEIQLQAEQKKHHELSAQLQATQERNRCLEAELQQVRQLLLQSYKTREEIGQESRGLHQTSQDTSFEFGERALTTHMLSLSEQLQAEQKKMRELETQRQEEQVRNSYLEAQLRRDNREALLRLHQTRLSDVRELQETSEIFQRSQERNHNFSFAHNRERARAQVLTQHQELRRGQVQGIDSVATGQTLQHQVRRNVVGGEIMRTTFGQMFLRGGAGAPEPFFPGSFLGQSASASAPAPGSAAVTAPGQSSSESSPQQPPAGAGSTPGKVRVK